MYITPKPFTFDQLPGITVADFVTDFVANCVTGFCIFLVFLIGVENHLVIKNAFLNTVTIVHRYFLLSIIFYESLVVPYCVSLMDNGKLLEIFRCKSLSRYRGENT